MESQRISHVKSEDRSSVIASFFLGIATTLFILLYWISIPNILVFSFLSLATFVIFITIALLLAKPRTQKTVKVRKVAPLKKEIIREQKPAEEKPKQPKYIGSTKTQVYHKNTCRFAKSIKPQYKAESDDKSFFKKYKACNNCKPQK